MSDELILFDTPLDGVVRLTLNRPAAFNALSEQMLSALQQRLGQIDAMRPAPKVLILAAAGKAFCAGHDLKQMRAQPSLSYYQTLFAQCSQVMLVLQKLSPIVIAQVQGIATAAGCQLVAMCDLAVASASARFAVSGVNLGLFCATPSVALSRALPRKQAMQMLVTGEFISASDARDWGLINEVVDDSQLTERTLALAQQITRKPAPALHLGKQLFYAQVENRIEQAYALACQTMAQNMMDPTALEGVQAFIEKRPPQWD